MLKPERLVIGLTEAYKKYKESDESNVDANFDTLNNLLKRFISTNMFYWGSVNVENSECELLISKDNSWVLCEFIEESSGKMYVVPVRIVKYFGDEIMHLPKIFKVGTYYLGKRTISLDAGGVFHYDKTERVKPFYVDLLTAQPRVDTAFTDICNQYKGNKVIITETIDAKLGIYRRVGFGILHALNSNELIVHINPAVCNTDVHTKFKVNGLGLTRVTNGQDILVLGLRNGYFTDHGHYPVTKAYAFINNVEWKVESLLKNENLLTMTPLTRHEAEQYIQDDFVHLYANESYLRVAK